MPLTLEEDLKRARRVLETAATADIKAMAEARVAEIERRIAQGQARVIEQSDGNSGLRDEHWGTIRDRIAAPYRFVPLNHKVVGPERAPIRLDEPRDADGSAVLTVTWGVETPLLVGRSMPTGRNSPDIVQPMSLGGAGRYVIPGATLRGLVRSSLEIITFARLRPVNDHFRFGLRDFTHARFRDNDQFKIGDDHEVKAGWLKKHGNQYTITPCAEDGRDWGYVEIDSFTTDKISWVKLKQQRKITHPERPQSSFSPTIRRTANGIEGQMIFEPDTNGRSGEFVVSGPVTVRKRRAVDGTMVEETDKRFEYVFFEDAGAQAVTITDDAWTQFEVMNCRQGRRGFEPQGAWGDLHRKLEQPEGRLPVFWVGDLKRQEEGFAFGLTRLFKIPHAFSVGNKIPDGLKPGLDANGDPELDFVAQLFGDVYERQELEKLGAGAADERKSVARKSRVAFGFAKPTDHAAFELWPKNEAVDTIMMAPRASYAPYYLTGTAKDWSEDAAQLAGRKRYPPRYCAKSAAAAPGELAERLQDPIERFEVQARRAPEAKVRSRLRFLRPTTTDAAFKSTIKLHNVTEVELGAVLWALTFGNDTKGLYRHMLGRAKGMGAGQTAVRSIEITWRPHGGDAVEEAWPATANDALPVRLMKSFEDYMQRATGQAWQSSETIEVYRKLHAPGTWAGSAGKLEAAVGATWATIDRRQRVTNRWTAEGPLATSFLARPDLQDAENRKTTNDFQKIREATKLGHAEMPPVDRRIPEQLLTLPSAPGK